MKKLSYFIIPVTFLLLTGCRVEFNAQSNVRDDGSIERITTFNAVEPSDKEEILARYDLPKGGQWKDVSTFLYKFSKKADAPKVVSTYRAVQIVPPGQPAVDFKRWTQKKDRAATNQFSVKVTDRWFFKRFEYEESFKDLIRPEKIRSAADTIIDKGISIFHTELGSRIKDPKAVDQITEKLKIKYAALLHHFYTLVPEKGWDSPEVEALSDQIQKEFTSEAASKYLAKELPSLDNEANRKGIGEAFHATEAAMMEFFNDKNDLWAQEDVFGIHGVTIFQSYDFKISVRMPGKVLQSNSQKKENGALVWEFPGSKLNQTIKASSQKFFPERLLIVVLAILAIVGFLYYQISKPRKIRK